MIGWTPTIEDIEPAPELVATQPQLEAVMDRLSAQRAVAVDTESNSLYAYQERVCLIQFSIAQGDYLVDPLAEVDVSPLARLFADPGTEKVFHAAEYDVICLRRDFGFEVANLFDTMWAARILGWPKVGLGDIMMGTFGVRTDKRYQRHNWGRRPLEQEALIYACLDTHYLLPLRAMQGEALHQRQRWEEAQEVFAQVAASEAPVRAFDPQDFWRIKGAIRLTGEEQAILRQLTIWRDQEARRKDTPPFKVLGDSTLVALARSRPRSLADLAGIRGLRPHHVHRYGEGILRAVKLGLRARRPDLPLPAPRHTYGETERFRALREWRAEVAAHRGVDPEVVLGNKVLWSVAEANPGALEDLTRIEGLGPWKRNAYGRDLLRILTAR